MILSIYSMDKVVDLIRDTMTTISLNNDFGWRYQPSRKYFSNDELVVSDRFSKNNINYDIVSKNSKSGQYLKKICEDESALERFKTHNNPLVARVLLSYMPWIGHERFFVADIINTSELSEILAGENSDDLLKYLPAEKTTNI